MIATMRRITFLVVMALVLLAGLIGWTIKMEVAPSFPLHHSGIHANHLQADGPLYYCPPPPFSCL